MYTNIYRAVQGKSLTKAEFLRLSESDKRELFEFYKMYMDNGHWNVDKLTILQNEEKLLNMPPCFKQELLWRFNEFTTDSKFSENRFSNRIRMMWNIQIAKWVTQNPECLTEPLKLAILENFKGLPICKALEEKPKDFKANSTDVGITLVEPTSNKVVHPQEILYNSMSILARQLQTVLSSIEDKDLKRMKLQEKIKFADNAIAALKGGFNVKGPSTFTQINVNTNNIRELEKALLDNATK